MDFNSLKISGKEERKATEFDQASYELQMKVKKEEEKKDTIKADDIKTSTKNEKEGSANFTVNTNKNEKNSALAEEQLYSGKSLDKKLKAAIEEANKKLKPVKKEFSYSIHDKTNRIMITIKNSDTGEVLKEIPSEENLDMLAKIREMTGIVVDQKR